MAAALVCATAASLGARSGTSTAADRPIPVIYDTDFGTDIDDAWALALILASPELELKLVVTDSGDTTARARLVAKFLEQCGAGDVPVGIGIPGKEIPIYHGSWSEGYDLEAYPGGVIKDGVGAMIRLLLESEREMTLLTVGPVPNIAEALSREPAIAERARVVAMSGSVDLGYNGNSKPDPEYNVRAAAEASGAMYRAGWDLLIAPLDTAGQVTIKGKLYQKLQRSPNKCVRALLENYRIWERNAEWAHHDTTVESSVLFDALAVALAFRSDFCELESLRLGVTEDGYTRRMDDGAPVRAALRWQGTGGRGQARFERFLVRRLVR